MFKNLKSRKMIMLSNILIIFAVILIFIGISTYLDKGKPKDNNNSNNSDNSNAPRNTEYELKDNELVFNDYVYKLPEGWYINGEVPNVLNVYFSDTVDGVNTNIGAYISVEEIAATGSTKEDLFSGITFFENSIKKGPKSSYLGEGKLNYIKNTPIVVFDYGKDESSKLLLAYMPAYEGYFYDIQFYANRVIDGKEERYFDYDNLYIIATMLNAGVKVNV